MRTENNSKNKTVSDISYGLKKPKTRQQTCV